MRRFLLASLATAAIGMVGTSAQAATFISCGGASSCINGTQNVLLDTGSPRGGPGQTVGTGTVSGTQVQFTTTETAGLSLDASGQAVIGAVDGILNNLTFQLVTGAFTAAEFNLVDIGNADFNVTLTRLGAGGTVTTQSFLATGNGANRFGILAEAGEVITGVTISSPGTPGFDSLRQLRLHVAGVAVPEPGTWAMMLVGFGGIGMAMRRGRKADRKLAQLA